jgi:sulfate transport system ATP-binding protein
MALARALAVEPKVLLLDEPFGALDARVREELRTWLRRLHEEVQVTTVLVTHDQEEAMEVADAIVVMNHGRIEQTGTPRDLYEHPASPFVMSFIGQVNRIGDTYIRPHDVVIHPSDDGAMDHARIERLVYMGFEVRVELVLADGQRLWAQVTREDMERLEVQRGQSVGVDLSRRQGFGLLNDVTPPSSSVVGADGQEAIARCQA